ncbi:uncharacterized protein LOC131692123 [Topomyia yanbarensis]|uniref:uncharacterized protein LOC131692123 n=1 Tax=Topomyia yanbarensis TaxID=2498891 RepID=UPI00273B4425|nr:uncharacterized protein LOC131692123 [Topomyia yanbarensis]
MNQLTMLKVIILLLVIVYDASATDCRIYLRSNATHEKAPLLLKPKGALVSLLQPTGSHFQLEEGENTLIGCASSKNKIAELNEHLASVTCVKNQEFKLNGTKKQFTQLNCSSSISSSIKAQNRPCAGGTGVLFDIGFEILGIPFVKFFQSCYSLERSSVIFTEHEILGSSIDTAQISNDRPAFKIGGLKSNVRFSSVYTQNSQRERLTQLLGAVSEAEKYISSSSFFAKGHLTPDGDGVLDTWAGATYFYINAAPEWQVINVGNWVRVENAARSIAVRLNDTVKIFTGVYDILSLPDVNGRMVPITLAENSQLEAPKWFWKVLHHAASNSAIALITLNNPYASGGEYLCHDICDRNGWGHKEFQDLRKGFTYCCTVQELRKAIKFIPTKADASNILQFN